jgi:hypothetical protein
MNFKDKIVKHYAITKNENRLARIHYEDGVFYAELYDNSLYKLDEESLIISNSRLLYATPENTNYCEWTPKIIDKVINKLDKDRIHLKAISKYWSRFKEGDRVYGELIKIGKDSYFKVITIKETKKS